MSIAVLQSASAIVAYPIFQFGPISINPPSVEGIMMPGNIVHCNSGNWISTLDPTYSYEWLIENDPIPNATSNSYLIQGKDFNKLLKCRVTATNAYGSTNALTIEYLVTSNLLFPNYTWDNSLVWDNSKVWKNQL